MKKIILTSFAVVLFTCSGMAQNAEMEEMEPIQSTIKVHKREKSSVAVPASSKKLPAKKVLPNNGIPLGVEPELKMNPRLLLTKEEKEKLKK